MPLFKQDASDRFVPFEQEAFPDLERKLEDWIEANPHMLLEGEDLAVIARQPRTHFAKFLDLLAVDRSGATVVVELKRGEAPQEVVAQALEYASWVDSLTAEQLDDLAREYGVRRGIEAETVAEFYQRQFSSELSEDGAESDIVTFNGRQRIVIVAEHFTGEVEQTLRYIRTKFGGDVYAIKFTVHRAGESVILATETVVGREVSAPAPSTTRSRTVHESDEETRKRAATDFMREVVGHIDRWAESQAIDGLAVWHGPGSDARLKLAGTELLYWYHASKWMYAFIKRLSADHVERLRAGLSKPEQLHELPQYEGWRMHIATWDDMRLLEAILRERALQELEAARA